MLKIDRAINIALIVSFLSLPLGIAADNPPAKSKQRPDPALIAIEDETGLPRVLLIGDSVSIGYTLKVRELLKGKANVHRPLGNCSSTGYALDNLEKWLGEKRWDVIHFNFGLHDAKQPPEGIRHAPPDVYESNLRELLLQMKAKGSHLIWATTTPVPNGGNLSPIRRFGSIDQYNGIAIKVMQENGVAINDLNAIIAPQIGSVQKPNDVHFTDDGSAILAKQVAKAIEAELAKTK